MTNGISSSLPPILDENDFLELQNSGMAEFAQLYDRKEIIEGQNGLRTIYVMKDNAAVDGARLAKVESGGRIMVMHNFSRYYKSFFENPNLYYNKEQGDWFEVDPKAEPKHNKTTGQPIYPRFYTIAPEFDRQRLRTYSGQLQMLVQEQNPDTGDWHPPSDWMNISRSDGFMGNKASEALDGYLAKKPGVNSANGIESRFYYYAKLDAYWGLYNAVNKDNLTINLSDAIEGIGKGTLQDAMVACILDGWFKKANAVDIKAGTVTFNSVLDAQQALDLVFRRPGATGETFLDPLSNSVSVFVHGKATKDNWGDDFYTSAAWAWKTYDALIQAAPTRTVSVDNYRERLEAEAERLKVEANFGTVPENNCRYDALILPILTNIGTGETAVYYEDLELYKKEGVHLVADSYQVPVGYRVATAEESVKYWRDHPKQVIKVPKIPGSIIPITGEFGYPDGSITILADEYTLRIHKTAAGESMTVAFIIAADQPITPMQDRGGADQLGEHEGWSDLPGWYTYEQAYMLQQLCNQAAIESGFEATIRRREDEGFRYQDRDDIDTMDWVNYWVHSGTSQIHDYASIEFGLPFFDINNLGGREPGEGKVRVAKYAIQFDPGYFATQQKTLSDLIAAAELEGKDVVKYNCTLLTLAEAKEVLYAMELAEKGNLEALVDWVSANKALAGTIGFLLFLIAQQAGPKLKKWIDNMGSTVPEGTTLYRQQAWDNNVQESRSIGRTAEMRAIFQHYYDRLRNPNKPYKGGTLHAPPGAGKTWLLEAMGETLHLGVYPDGTPLEPQFRAMFGDVMDLNIGELVDVEDSKYVHQASAKIRAAIRWARRYHANTGKYCIIFIDEFYENLIAKGEPDGKGGHRSFMDTIFKQVKDQPILYGIATMNLHKNVGRDDPQIGERRAPIIRIPKADGTFATYENGMDEGQPYYVLQILKKTLHDLGPEYTMVDMSKLTDKFLISLIQHANFRSENGDPDRSTNELKNYLDYLRTMAERKSLRTIVPSAQNYQEYMQSTGGIQVSHPIINARAAIPRDAFNQPPFRMQGTPRSPNIQPPPNPQSRLVRLGSGAWRIVTSPVRGLARLFSRGTEAPPSPRNPSSGGPLPAPVQSPPPPTDVVSPATRAAVEAAFRGVTSPGSDIVQVLTERGFNEAQMLQLAAHMRAHPNVVMGLSHSHFGPQENQILAPEDILRLLNDQAFMQVAGRNYVTSAMIPTIIDIYTGRTQVRPGQFVTTSGSIDLSGPQDPGDIPTSAFTRGAPAYVRPAAGPPPRPAPVARPPTPAVEPDDNDDTDPGPTSDQRLLTQIQEGFLNFNPTTDLRTMQDNLQRWCRANSAQGGQVGDFLWTTYQTARAQILTAHPALGFTNAELFCMRVLQATVTTMNNPDFAQLTDPTKIRQALLAAIQSHTQGLARAAASDTATQQAAVRELTARVNRVVDDLISRGITTHTPTRTRSGGH